MAAASARARGTAEIRKNESGDSKGEGALFIHNPGQQLANDLAAAEEQFKEQIKNNPEDLVSRLQIAAAMYKTNSPEGRIYAQQAANSLLVSPLATTCWGYCCSTPTTTQNAIPELEIAREDFPQEAKIYIAFGTAYSPAGKRQEAARVQATPQ